MWRTLYSLLWWLALPLVWLRLWWRGRRQPEYRQHVGERFGRYRGGLPGAVIWVHAVSVGETRAAVPLVNALLARDPCCSVLLTHMTPTGRATAADVFAAQGSRVRSVYLPYDLPWLVRRFLRHFRPQCGLLMETELWPNLIAECRRAGVPLALVNARLSARSARGYARLSMLTRPMLAALPLVVAQNEADMLRLKSSGAENVVVSGNLKFDHEPPSALLALAREIRGACAGRPVLLAASTREGEEALLLQAFASLALADVLLVVVPRHPQRFDDVGRLIDSCGLRWSRRSAWSPGEALPAGVQVWLGDSMGEMFAYYAAADVTLMGGSFLPFGGQNLIESCSVGTPVLLGPHTFNFAAVAEDAVQAGAALRCADAAQAVRQGLTLLGDEAVRQQMGAAARQFAGQHGGATRRTLAALAQAGILPAVV